MSDVIHFLDFLNGSVRSFFLTFECDRPSVDEFFLIQKGQQLEIVAKKVLDQLQTRAPTFESCSDILSSIKKFHEERKSYYRLCRPNFDWWLLEQLYTLFCGIARFPKVTLDYYFIEEQSSVIESEFSAFLGRCKNQIKSVQKAQNTCEALGRYRSFCQILSEENKYPFLKKLGDCYRILGMHQKALECYQKLHVSPECETEVVLRKVSCFLGQWKPVEAEALLLELFGKKENMHEKITKKAWSEFIVAKLQKKEFVQAIAACLDAIKEFPGENQFRLKLIEAYLSSDDKACVFIENIDLLHHYFAEQSSYLQLARNFDDLFTIFFDFLDYASRRSCGVMEYACNLFSTNAQKEQIAPLLAKSIHRRFEVIQKKIEQVKTQITSLRNQIQTKVLNSEEIIAELQMRIHTIGKDVNGQSASAHVPIGMLQYLRSYAKIVDTYANASIPILMKDEFAKMKNILSQLQPEVIRLHSEVSNLQVDLQTRILKENHVQQETQEEELSLGEWEKRHKVFKFLEDAFIPTTDREKSREFLFSHGIILDQLFTTDLLRHTQDLSGYLQQKQVSSITDLSKYVREYNQTRNSSI